MGNTEKLTKEIEIIKQRNARVELDKAWEISLTRRFSIAILTYLVIVLFFYFANLPKPFINAIVPTIGFILSTLRIGFVKKVWMRLRKYEA